MDSGGKEYDAVGAEFGIYPNDDQSLNVQIADAENKVNDFLERLEEYRQELVLYGENEDTEDLLYQLLESISVTARLGRLYKQLNRDFRGWINN